jgi:hypothetical protein
MKTLHALVPITNGKKPVAPGEPFEVEDDDVAALVAVGAAREATEDEVAAKPPKGKK